MSLERDSIWADTRDGWSLHLLRTIDRERFDPSRRPLVIVPGYGMNGFIFGFHPRGTSLEAHLASEGIEVWTVDLRMQGRSRARHAGAAAPSLAAYADEDLPRALTAIGEATRTRHERVDVIGASLGGSIVFAHVARHRPHPIAATVAVGSPLRWEEVPPILRVAFGSRRIAGAVPIRGARRLASAVLPVVRRVPALLAMYMNAAHVDLDAASELVRTVEDPHPQVNRDLAAWMKTRDLVIDGVNVTEALRAEAGPLLVVLANRDGIVPERVARSAIAAWGGSDVTELLVGDEREWYAHADLFVGHESPSKVFDPIARWLRERA